MKLVKSETTFGNYNTLEVRLLQSDVPVTKDGGKYVIQAGIDHMTEGNRLQYIRPVKSEENCIEQYGNVVNRFQVYFKEVDKYGV